MSESQGTMSFVFVTVCHCRKQTNVNECLVSPQEHAILSSSPMREQMRMITEATLNEGMIIRGSALNYFPSLISLLCVNDFN